MHMAAFNAGKTNNPRRYALHNFDQLSVLSSSRTTNLLLNINMSTIIFVMFFTFSLLLQLTFFFCILAVNLSTVGQNRDQGEESTPTLP